MRRVDQHPRLLPELCALLFAVLPSPRSSHAPSRGVSPVGIASFLLGASLAMMLGGSMMFLVGFLLLPWVIGLVMVLYLVGIFCSLSGLGRAILCLSRKADLGRRGGIRSSSSGASNFSDLKITYHAEAP